LSSEINGFARSIILMDQMKKKKEQELVLVRQDLKIAYAKEHPPTKPQAPVKPYYTPYSD